MGAASPKHHAHTEANTSAGLRTRITFTVVASSVSSSAASMPVSCLPMCCGGEHAGQCKKMTATPHGTCHTHNAGRHLGVEHSCGTRAQQRIADHGVAVRVLGGHQLQWTHTERTTPAGEACHIAGESMDTLRASPEIPTCKHQAKEPAKDTCSRYGRCRCGLSRRWLAYSGSSSCASRVSQHGVFGPFLPIPQWCRCAAQRNT